MNEQFDCGFMQHGENGFAQLKPLERPKGGPFTYASTPPDPSSSDWQDISARFKNAAKTLQLGELVHDNSFSLFEGMSAIELMDPKMDAGMVQRSLGSKPISFESAVASGKLILANIPQVELIAVMDATMACWVTWLEGHSLAQTVYTNLYTHKPYEIQDRILKAFTIGVLKITSICAEVIRRAYVCEEEDFQPSAYGFQMCTDLSDSRVIGMLKEADDDCQKTIRNIKGKPMTEDSQASIDLNEAVSTRIRFLRYLLIAITSLAGKEDPNKALLKLISTRSQVNFEDAEKALEQCKTLVERLAATAQLGVQCDHDEDGTYSFLPSFVPNVNQRLLPPTFPRKTRLFSPTATIDYMRRLVQQLVTVCTLPERAGTFAAALEFFRDFSRKDNFLLSRSILQVAYGVGSGKVLGKMSFEDAIKEAMRDFIQPPVLHPKCTVLADPQCQQVFEDFIANCCRILPELLRTCGYNRARQRDRLATALEDLATLQEEADRVDGLLNTVLNRPNQPSTAVSRNHLTCLGSFVLYHILVAMIDYLLLGFELELYSVYEYAGMYWYAHEFLFKWLINVLHKADNCIYEQDQANSKVEKSKGEKKKKATKKKLSKMHRLEIVHLQSKQKLCEGYYRTMLGFYALKRVRVPVFAGGDDHDCIRYEHRLAPFAHLATPPMIGYSQFLDISNFKHFITNVPASRLFTEAAQCFEEVRLSLENIPSGDESENVVLIRICKMNVIILRLLASGHQSDAKDWPIFDFQLHRNFPVVKLK